MIIENRFIDLGLPSGTLWADENEEGYYTFDEAAEKYGDNLPTREQFMELEAQCQWEWVGDRYKVTGTNGNTIVLSADGFHIYDGYVYDIGSIGLYWSSTPNGSDNAWGLDFSFNGVCILNGNRCYGRSVRLVKNTTK